MLDPSRPAAITIARQTGSGGSWIGQLLARRLGFRYADRAAIAELVRAEAEPARPGRIPLAWDPFTPFGLGIAEAYLPPSLLGPTPADLFDAEAEAIGRLAADHSVVVVGRCGVHALRDHPNRFHVYLHADRSFRRDRIRSIHGLSAQEADERIAEGDRDRSDRFRDLSGRHWTDARLYDLCLDTGRLGVEEAAATILRVSGLS